MLVLMICVCVYTCTCEAASLHNIASPLPHIKDSARYPCLLRRHLVLAVALPTMSDEGRIKRSAKKPAWMNDEMLIDPAEVEA